MTALRPAVFLLFVSFFARAQPAPTLDYYLSPARADQSLSYRADVPTPAQFLGYEVGEWHVSHDQLVGYMRALDRASDRITLREYGRTHEHRPLVCLFITSPQNHGRLDALRQQHRDLADPAKNPDPAAAPGVVYMGYSIHGNEASGSNAALVVAYHLAAAQGAAIDSLLENTVILLDPCFNPDGLQRFSSWVNSRRGKNGATDPASDEFNEPWPRGRTNHYWFDLNRDWLVMQQPESPGRVDLLQAWKPNVLTDHHEMGSNATFFFQPGVPSRVNPLTPKRNQELTAKIAEYHADILSKNNIAFFTGESYDDYYYGKGSTYPDVNGAVGILFEQASSRGSAQMTDNGLLTFAFTVRNQVFTSLSTLKAVREMRVELNRYLQQFYKTSLEEARRDRLAGYLFELPEGGEAEALPFVTLLDRHKIEVYRMPQAEAQAVRGSGFNREAFYVPLTQPQYRLVRAIFDRPTQFTDSIFYDISAWTLPDAFGLHWTTVAAGSARESWTRGTRVDAQTLLPTRAPGSTGTPAGTAPYALVVHPQSPRRLGHLTRLQQAGVAVRVAQQPFTVDGRRYPAGTLLAGMAGQSKPADQLRGVFAGMALDDTAFVRVVSNGLTPDGPDLGSANFAPVRAPKVALVTGDGINPADAGEAWHALDVRLGLPATQVEGSRLGATSLSGYNVLILPDGTYRGVSSDRVRDFLNGGGTVIASGGALRWLRTVGLAALEFRNGDERGAGRRPYGSLAEDRGAANLAGAIFEAELDLTHPLCFGYARPRLPMFLGDTIFIETAKNPYATPAVFTREPLLAGYLHPSQRELVRGAAAVVVAGYGRGRIVCFAGSPNFRAFWYGTERMFANAVFFGGLISGESVERK